MKNQGERVATLEERINNMQEINSQEHQAIIKKIDDMCKNFVSNDRFSPVEKIVYALVGLICTGVILAVLSFVLRKPL